MDWHRDHRVSCVETFTKGGSIIETQRRFKAQLHIKRRVSAPHGPSSQRWIGNIRKCEQIRKPKTEVCTERCLPPVLGFLICSNFRIFPIHLLLLCPWGAETLLLICKWVLNLLCVLIIDPPYMKVSTQNTRCARCQSIVPDYGIRCLYKICT